jgi:hypothetical protein
MNLVCHMCCFVGFRIQVLYLQRDKTWRPASAQSSSVVWKNFIAFRDQNKCFLFWALGDLWCSSFNLASSVVYFFFSNYYYYFGVNGEEFGTLTGKALEETIYERLEVIHGLLLLSFYFFFLIFYSCSRKGRGEITQTSDIWFIKHSL